MKSEKKMDEAIFMLNRIKDTNDVLLARELASRISTMLQEFLVDNSASSKKKFDMFNYTGKEDPARPIMAGVCHDTVNKCAIATDAHLLVIDRVSYDPTVETRFAGQLDKNGRVCLDRYGNKIDSYADYPEYTRVLPSEESFQSSEHLYISPDDVNEYIKHAKAYIRTNELRGVEIRYKVGDTLFDAKLLLSFLIASEGNIAITKQDKNTSPKGLWYSDERQCLLMPMSMSASDMVSKNLLYGVEEGLFISNVTYF